MTEETVETLYLLGEDARIVGVSGYAVRPPRVRREKPRVSAFISADIPKILALNPDLVLTFSDLQADIVAGLIREGIQVLAFNQRSVADIFDMIGMVSAIVGRLEAGKELACQLRENCDAIRVKSQNFSRRPRVYFEEWDEPMIAGLQWVSDIIDIAGGINVFQELAYAKAAKDRIVSAEQIIEAAPDIIIGSWCGKKFKSERLVLRPGFDQIPAVIHGHLYEIKSPLILQPGPAALTDGLQAVADIIQNWVAKPPAIQ